MQLERGLISKGGGGGGDEWVITGCALYMQEEGPKTGRGAKTWGAYIWGCL